MDYDPLRPETRDEQRQTQSKREENARALELADLLFVMSDPAGRRFIHRQLTKAHIWATTYIPGDTHQTAFNEGARNRGLKLLADIMEVAAAQYALMIEEAKHVD